jgi:hypothetical protein
MTPKNLAHARGISDEILNAIYDRASLPEVTEHHGEHGWQLWQDALAVWQLIDPSIDELGAC